MNDKAVFIFVVIIALALPGCASDRAFREGERLLAQGQTEAGLRQLEQAVRDEPNNVQYRTAYIQARETHVNRLLAEADKALGSGREQEAEARYRNVLRLDDENLPARAGLASIVTLRRNRTRLDEARVALARNEIEPARSLLRGILAREPAHAEALALLKQMEEKAGKPSGAAVPGLAAAYRRPVTLQFRDAPIRTIFDALSNMSGLNFVFDKDMRTDTRLTVFAADMAIADALDTILKTGQMEKKVLNENTLLIFAAVPAKLKEYQDLVVKSFFLSNADPKVTVNLIRSMAKTRDIHVDEKLNLVVVRDTPEAVRLVEKLVTMVDRPEPEVMLEVEILEVKRSRLQELGVQWPAQFSLLAPQATTTSRVEGGVIVTDSVPAGVITVESLKNVNSAGIAVSPNPALNLRKDTGDVNILANPRIRVKNKEKARIHIGDKVPVITSNVTPTGVTSESVSYLDVGIKVDVEPRVHLEGDVGIKVGLEVSNIVQQIKSATGTLTYQLGSRNASTVLRLRDGETQVLAGLISDEDRAGASKVPLFGDIPLLGRLFSSQRDEISKTEIVLLITPRIIRNIERPELAVTEFFGGTENAASVQAPPLRVPSPGGVPSSGAAAQPPAPGVVQPPFPPSRPSRSRSGQIRITPGQHLGQPAVSGDQDTEPVPAPDPVDE